MVIISIGIVFLIFGLFFEVGEYKTASILAGSFLIGFDLSFRFVKWAIKESPKMRSKLKSEISKIEGDRYPMCKDQPAQIDCRITVCKYHTSDGKCSNVSPAITLNPDESFYCWSKNI